MKIYIISEEDYRGEHSAPETGFGAPLNDLSGIYPYDIYSIDGARLYGTGESFDNFSISIIHQARNRPNLPIKIYRAVPLQNQELNKKIKDLQDIVSYHSSYGFFPVNNKIIHEFKDKYPIEQYSYDDQKASVYRELQIAISDLQSQKVSEIKINSGDWVTINREYAKKHGEDNLRNVYRIISKTVKAKDLYTDGGSIHEWGYNP